MNITSATPDTDLLRAMRSAIDQGAKLANDAELILHAYHAWGDDCVNHLIGDFAFAIWDGRERRVFCARDHFGVKPFYYAQRRHFFVFSNTLTCVRLHPSVPDDLNDLAIADFLLFGVNRDASTTAFEGIARLPAAGALTLSATGARRSRYWALSYSVIALVKRSAARVRVISASRTSSARPRPCSSRRCEIASDSSAAESSRSAASKAGAHSHSESERESSQRSRS